MLGGAVITKESKSPSSPVARLFDATSSLPEASVVTMSKAPRRIAISTAKNVPTVTAPEDQNRKLTTFAIATGVGTREAMYKESKPG